MFEKFASDQTLRRLEGGRDCHPQPFS
jgi:hypothetical protein